MAELRPVNSVRERWDQGRPAVVGWLQSSCPLVAETVASLPLDGVVIDLQHSLTDFSSCARMIVAANAAGKDALVRIASLDQAEIGKLLDAGAGGIIVPMISSAAEMAMIGEAAHYPPQGTRSYGPRRPLLRYGSDYYRNAAKSVVTFGMVETVEVAERLDELLEVSSVDGIFIGPTDLALSMGLEPIADSSSPPLVELISTVREKAHRAGRRIGIFCVSAKFARQKLAEGFDFVSVAPDLVLIKRELGKALGEVEPELARRRDWRR